MHRTLRGHWGHQSFSIPFPQGLPSWVWCSAGPLPAAAVFSLLNPSLGAADKGMVFPTVVLGWAGLGQERPGHVYHTDATFSPSSWPSQQQA